MHISKTIVFDGKLYEMDKDKPFTGIVFNAYPNGEREYQGEYKRGKPNGLLIYWNENGKKMREGELKSGAQMGRWKYYDNEGDLTKIIDY